MPRIARKNIDTPFLHVMVQGVNKEYVFYKKEYIEEYLKIINKNRVEYSIEIIAYCIMNNHAHFLIHANNKIKLGQFMQRSNLEYAQKYNKKEKRCGVLFRNRYKSEPIYNTKYLINCIKYIHNNPVKAKIVSKCEDYLYSSYNDYINNIGVTKNKIIKSIFGEKCNYKELFDKEYERRYMDVDEEKTDYQEYIIQGIVEFKKRKRVKIEEILSNRQVLKEMIAFLHTEYKIKYIEMRTFLEIPRGTMDLLKSN